MSAEEMVFEKTIDLLIDIGPKIANLPRNERATYRDKVNETYRLFDISISLIMNRFGDILSLPRDQPNEFFQKIRNLNNVPEWINIERDVLLCRHIREANREFESFWTQMKARLALKDNEATTDYLQNIVAGERALADYITNSLTSISQLANDPSLNDYNIIRQKIEDKLKELRDKRLKLVQSEILLYDSI